MVEFADIPEVAPEGITLNQSGTIEGLLQSCALDHDDRARIEAALDYMTAEEAQEVINYLLTIQLDRIDYGLSYNQSDITKKIRTKLNNPRA